MPSRQRKVDESLGLIVNEMNRRPIGHHLDIHDTGYPARERQLDKAAPVFLTSPGLVRAAPNPGLVACEKLPPVMGEPYEANEAVHRISMP
jgi:hypothetical protein